MSGVREGTRNGPKSASVIATFSAVYRTVDSRKWRICNSEAITYSGYNSCRFALNVVKVQGMKKSAIALVMSPHAALAD